MSGNSAKPTKRASSNLLDVFFEERDRSDEFIDLIDAIYIICNSDFDICFINELGRTTFKIQSKTQLGNVSDYLYALDEHLLDRSPLSFNKSMVFPKDQSESSTAFLISVSQSSHTDEFYLLLHSLDSNQAYTRDMTRVLQINKTLSKMADYSSSSIVVLDENQVISYVNQSARDIFGYASEEVLGRSIKEFTHNFDTDIDTRRLVMSAIRSGTQAQGVGEFCTKDGTRVWTSFELFPVDTLPGEPKAGVLISNDITDKVAMEQDLAQAKLLLEEVSIERTRLLANISHELRTPLTSIKGILNELSTGNTSALDEAALDIAQHAADSLNAIIADMLSYARGSIDHFEIITATSELKSFAIKLEGLAKQQYSSTNIDFSVSIKEPYPPYILIDSLHMQQVLLNLISNAFKFCKVGSIQVLLSCEPALSNSDEYIFKAKVIDTGIGIEKNKLSSIFTPFRQLDNQPSRATQGLGLGLAIVKKLVDLMNGDISVKSVVNEGTTFSLCVPTKSVNKKLAINEIQDTLPPVGLNILLVDDNEINAAIVQRHLAKIGNEVSVVHNGKAAVKALDKSEFDIILMDIQMPIMDGFEASAIIRSGASKGWSNKKINTPIIGFTADSTMESIDNCTKVGMNTVVHKPINYQHLYAAINDCLSEQRDDTVRAAAHHDTNPEYIADFHHSLCIESTLASKLSKIFDLNIALAYAEGDLAFLKECFESFLHGSDEVLNFINHKQGSDTFETELQFLSHRLSSTAGILGATKLSNQCKKLSETIKKTARVDDFDLATLSNLLVTSREGTHIILSAYQQYQEDA